MNKKKEEEIVQQFNQLTIAQLVEIFGVYTNKIKVEDILDTIENLSDRWISMSDKDRREWLYHCKYM